MNQEEQAWIYAEIESEYLASVQLSGGINLELQAWKLNKQ